MSELTVNQLLEALLDGNQARAVAESRKLLENGVKPEQIIT